ncbi:hypothetical protein [Paenibacillus sp. NEAU-GSW1]|uniref:hypothetical protein n=1 Tax=Paenibacillus sp. NEAU-GSW1 TaxID=2682486 RepID=UPI0012E2C1B6|nr:hypothetical protein [Paenibacillus sp. NEAU-GSW1]MUT67457.1 hypothetical protein [Paenibacillus sp. NEAU-GSW1]
MAVVGKQKQLQMWPRRPFLDKMLDDGESPNKCAAWCKEKGFDISVPTMYEYARKRRAAIIGDVQADKLRSGKSRGKRVANNPTKAERKAAHMTVDKVKHDLELLDEVIQKGFETLANIEEINPATAIAAIQLKHKITKGTHNGYTVYGIEEIKLREAARENAIVAAILKFVPEENHSAVMELMEQVTRDYYISIGLDEAYEQMSSRGDKGLI